MDVPQRTPLTRQRCRTWSLGVFLLVGLMLPGIAVGAETPLASPPEELSEKRIEAQIQQFTEAKDLDETLRTSLLEIYRQALQELLLAKDWAAKAAQYQQDAQAVPERLTETKTKLARLPSKPEETFEVESLRELEQLLAQKERELEDPETGARKLSADLEAEPTRRAGRRKDIPGLISAADARHTEAKRQSDALSTATDPPQVIAARRVLLLARHQATEQELAAHRAELAKYDAADAVDLLRLRRDLATRQLALLQQEVGVLREMVNRRLQEAAKERVRRASKEALESHSLLKPIAENNVKLAREEQLLIEQIQQLGGQLERTRKGYEELRAQFTRTRQMVEDVGMTEAIGRLLRKQRTGPELSDVRQLRRQITARGVAIRDAQFRWFELDDERSELAHVEALVEDLLSELQPEMNSAIREELEMTALELLGRKRDQLDSLIRHYNSYFETLVRLQSAEQQSVREAEAYTSYIDERVLWISTSPPLEGATFSTAGRALRWLFQPDGWQSVVLLLLVDGGESVVPTLLAIVTLLPLLVFHRRFRHKVRELGELAEKSNCRVFVPTLEALFLTLGLSAFGPVILWFIGWRLSEAPDSGDFVRAVSFGLRWTAGVYLPLEILRQICSRKGLGEAHFGWPHHSVRTVRLQLRWLMLLGLPLTFVAATIQAVENNGWQDSLGRLACMLALLLVAVFLQRVPRANGGIFREAATRDRGWTFRLHSLWFPLGTSVPLVLMLLAGFGFYYTALQLTWRLQATLWLLLGLFLARAVLLRWVLIRRRRIALEQARERRAAAEQEVRQSTDPQASSLPQPTEQEIDLATISTQSQRLLHTAYWVVATLGLWLIWVDVLPALGILDRMPLWYTKIEVTEQVPTPHGETEIKTHEQQKAITIADFALAVLIVTLAWVAGRNFPGLLEITLLNHLPIEPGVRYAVKSLVSYVLVIVGFMLAFGMLGIGWSKVQWLLAAVTVGLGFGLQEIFANFVSGLILLFERPIRVGDVITIEQTTGVVSRIRIRATTITTWDRKELIVPNREFITGRLLNWTLSDQVNRIQIDIGIAYGSDTNLARDLLLKVARESRFVLNDPPPIATFEGFGDSALNLTLRVYLPDLDNRLNALHDLNTAIHKTFRQAGIDIAFPQRDLHLRTVPAALLEPKLVAAERNGNGVAHHV